MDFLPEKQYLRRAQLAGGKAEEGNGFAMWRRPHRDNHGEGQIVEYAGTQCLREYGRCRKLEDVAAHIDGWYELFEQYGHELEGAHMMTRGMFLDIVPTELRTEILKEPKLQNAGHRSLAEWCRNRVLILTSEKLAELRKKEITGRSKIASLRNKPEGVSTGSAEPDVSDTSSLAQQLCAVLSQLQPLAAVQPPPRKPSSTGAARRNGSPGRRSPSPGKRLLPDWGNKCFHCGSDKHSRTDCASFKKMMEEHNRGVPKADWKAPPGYKSAIGKARDAARALQAKVAPKAKSSARPIRALMENDADVVPDIDTASDSDFSSDNEGTGIHALRRASPISFPVQSSPHPINTMNRFDGLSEGQQSYDQEMLQQLNSWAHNVRVRPRAKKAKADAYPEIEHDVRFIAGKAKPHETIVIQSVRDLDKASADIKPLPSSRKSLSKVVKRISSQISCGPDEKLVMVDSGAFTSAINARTELPQFQLIPISIDEQSPDGESACGGILKCYGRVKTTGTVEGIPLDVTWQSMDVKVPILSVRQLIKNKCSVRFHKGGGYIKNTVTCERIPFFEHQGVYYLKMKFKSPKSPHPESGFAQPEP